MSKSAGSESQARIRKEKAERDAKMAKQKADRLAIVASSRLKDIGHEIKVRVGKLDQLGGKAVDMVDSIDHLLADAEKLCDPTGHIFGIQENLLSRAWAITDLRIARHRDGRKTIEEIRADTRKRVAKHRVGKQDVTESDFVTSAGRRQAEAEAPVAAPVTELSSGRSRK